MQPAPADVLVHARILAWMEDGGLPVDLGLVEEDDYRARTWDRLRTALRPVAEGDGADDPHGLARGARALVAERIVRLEAGERLDDAPDGRLAALAGTRPDLDVVACALVLDDLRRLDRERRISGDLGWAMRRWAWGELDRALRRLATDDPDAHRRAADAADRQLRRNDASGAATA